MTRYHFKVDPVPASRPRVSRWSTYYPKKYQAFKDSMLIITDHTKFDKVESGPIKVTTRIYLAMPKSWSKKKKGEMRNQWKDNNSDNDNYEKAVWDALNGLAWTDDCQIVWNETKIKYADEGGIYIVVERL